MSPAESLLGAGKRLQIEGWWGVVGGGWGEREERGGRRRMYPQCSCGVSNMALVPCKKERERANKQWPSDSAHLLQLPLPTHMDYAHMVPVLQYTVTRIRLEHRLGILNILLYCFCYSDYCYGDNGITATVKYQFYQKSQKMKILREKNSLTAMFLNKVQSGNCVGTIFSNQLW